MVTSIPSGLRYCVGALRNRIRLFEERMSRHLVNAGRRGDFLCAEYGISFGGGQKVRIDFVSFIATLIIHCRRQCSLLRIRHAWSLGWTSSQIVQSSHGLSLHQVRSSGKCAATCPLTANLWKLYSRRTGPNSTASTNVQCKRLSIKILYSNPYARHFGRLPGSRSTAAGEASVIHIVTSSISFTVFVQLSSAEILTTGWVASWFYMR